MNFIILDFETLNEKQSYDCSLGLTVIKDNYIMEKIFLIKPQEIRFNLMNILIHRITTSDVKDAKTFDQLWPEIFPYFTNNIIMSHNASFDFRVLRHPLDTYAIPYPTCRYGWTMIWAINFFPYLENVKLNTVNHYLELEFNHLHASSDTYSRANIVLTIQKKLTCNQLEKLCQTVGLKLGSHYKGDDSPAKL